MWDACRVSISLCGELDHSRSWLSRGELPAGFHKRPPSSVALGGSSLVCSPTLAGWIDVRQVGCCYGGPDAAITHIAGNFPRFMCCSSVATAAAGSGTVVRHAVWGRAPRALTSWCIEEGSIGHSSSCSATPESSQFGPLPTPDRDGDFQLTHCHLGALEPQALLELLCGFRGSLQLCLARY